MLRIDEDRLARRDPEELRIELVDGAEKTRRARRELRRPVPLDPPPLRRRADAVAARAEQLPERLERIGAGEPAAHADDRDRPRVRVPGAARRRVRRRGLFDRQVMCQGVAGWGVVEQGRGERAPEPAFQLRRDPDHRHRIEAKAGKRSRRVDRGGGTLQVARQPRRQPVHDLAPGPSRLRGRLRNPGGRLGSRRRQGRFLDDRQRRPGNPAGTRAGGSCRWRSWGGLPPAPAPRSALPARTAPRCAGGSCARRRHGRRDGGGD